MTEPNTLGLPAPSEGSNEEVKMDGAMKFDALGPLVVNSDGTLSRIANWPNMTSEERERTMRVLGARNRLRMDNEYAKLKEQVTNVSSSEGQPEASS
ncbi:hypothetical protein M422DRAFT_780198 [Sphaerobolus stellatus SS14]|uniref:Uncharacterized protein n=1 Tax=Sphaerobolus stellatus (strain SS14) TaxID=990650 RepID=A0A0C9VUU2_SPHS4|nr:hypothetical protein M422DRAFT_780198 [Sphaerobolus stellatus SS14]